MKRVLLIIACIIMLVIIILTTMYSCQTGFALAADQAAVDEYQGMLDSRHDENNKLDEDTKDAMWDAFWGHINGVPEEIYEGVKDVSSSKQYVSETLAGGNGIGYKDGAVRTAKLNDVYSMAVDKDGNIYFIDIPTNSVRRYVAKDKMIKTFKKCDEDFDLNIEDEEGKLDVVDHKEALIAKLAYNPYNNRIYAGVDYPRRFSVIYMLNPEAYLETYDNSGTWPFINSIYYNDFIKFDAEGHTWFSNRVSSLGDPSKILMSERRSMAEQVGFCSKDTIKDQTFTCPKFMNATEAILGEDGNTLYIYDATSNGLYKFTAFPSSLECIALYKGFYNTVTSYKDHFYVANDNSIYQINLDGSIKKLIDPENLKYKNGTKISKINAMTVDTSGNLILYDLVRDKFHKSLNGSIRKIVMN